MNKDELIKKADIQKIVTEGAKIYEKIKDKYEPKKNGKFLAIDIDTEEIFFAEDSAEAVDKARTKYPNKVFYVVRIGFEAAETMAKMFFEK